jgi:hypothetical protein
MIGTADTVPQIGELFVIGRQELDGRHRRIVRAAVVVA